MYKIFDLSDGAATNFSFMRSVAADANNLKEARDLFFISRQIRTINKVNLPSSKSCLSSRLARSLLKAVILNKSGLRGSLYLIEIHQHENV